MEKYEIIDKILEKDGEVISDVMTELIMNSYYQSKGQSLPDIDESDSNEVDPSAELDTPATEDNAEVAPEETPEQPEATDTGDATEIDTPEEVPADDTPATAEVPDTTVETPEVTDVEVVPAEAPEDVPAEVPAEPVVETPVEPAAAESASVPDTPISE